MTDARGIEVGHIFKSGTKYSKDMNALYQDEHGEKYPIIMGCYGLGVSRTLAAAIEAHNDADGMRWPISIAPFEVLILVANAKDEAQMQAGQELYAGLKQRGVDVLLDEREERIGVKFRTARSGGYSCSGYSREGVGGGRCRGGFANDEGGAAACPGARRPGVRDTVGCRGD